jgi:hypothetical protein
VTAKQKRKKYILGNVLRGWFEGYFADANTAWRYLSKRFLLSYPARQGRGVSLYVYEHNSYGLEQFVLCRTGITWRGSLPKSTVLSTCQHANVLSLNP